MEEEIELVDPHGIPISISTQSRWTLVRKLALMLMALVPFLALLTKLHSYNDSWKGLDFRSFAEDLEGNFTWPADKLQDKLLGGLLSDGLDEKSCRSRYASALYHRATTRFPSSYLISKLRSYEALHRKCGPDSESYQRSLELFRSKNHTEGGCKYIVWLPRAGLGNRMITLASTFLYALLTDRVLLVDREAHLPDLFCEPFPGSSWIIPSQHSFPINDFKGFDHKSPKSLGNMLKKKAFGSNLSLPLPYVYAHLESDYGDGDKRFFCDEEQTALRKVSWLLVRSDLYFAPSLFLIPSFQQQLEDMFPDKEAVFHLLGRYLFHPSNPVWRAITRYYNAYLARAAEKIGIQVRVLNSRRAPFKQVLKQVLGCVFQENLLPQIDRTRTRSDKFTGGNGTQRHKAVLITSLAPDYYEAVRDMYEKHGSVTGEAVEVYQPSHEGRQRMNNGIHDMKAWAEIYLLSLTDKLVTTSKSTFGYVAQSLGDVKPWILYKPEEYKEGDDQACRRGGSMEPCFQAPPCLDCKTGGWVDTSKMVPYVKHCEDMKSYWGLKLFGT
ncbi:hypothetical protein DM860_006063 [Cuscuta australis]|uniref:Fucosyltransferase n=1 Tax=Cuscuta australis TaxID=267555 RepID=A0A328DNM8_9ASTE|nr:hypothetical protein DM860_006063 [Cuscuta australis]